MDSAQSAPQSATQTSTHPETPAADLVFDNGTVLVGSCLDRLKELPDCSVDAVVTDPPYEIAFMGRSWDNAGIAFNTAVWGECLRVLKPGGHLLAFGATRTYHRIAVAIEDAGFEIRDSIHWTYGSGFPKSLDVSKAIDKAAGAQREVVGPNPRAAQQTAKQGTSAYGDFAGASPDITAPATPKAAQWAGWGTALKPSHEPIVVARKPLSGTVTATVLGWGTGALNIDASRVGTEPRVNNANGATAGGAHIGQLTPGVGGGTVTGRFPANTILTHAATCGDACVAGCPVAVLDQQSGFSKDGTAVRRNGVRESNLYGDGFGRCAPGSSNLGYGGAGGASRFFTQTTWSDADDLTPFMYVSKPSKRERNAGVPEGTPGHPTVKPQTLMAHLLTMVTPPGGVVLDPFLGSGTTAVAATLNGFQFIGCELTAEYLPIIEGRVRWAHNQVNTPAPVVKPAKNKHVPDLSDGLGEQLLIPMD